MILKAKLSQNISISITRFFKHFAFTVLFLVSLFCQVTKADSAIPVVVEIEPNNTPFQALDFSAPTILSGSMSGSDQDAYLWRISDADALKLWDLTLHGIPEALTGVSIVRLKTGQDPNDPAKSDAVLGFEKLLTFGIRDGSRPVYRKNMFFPAGDYIVGLFQTGTSDGFKPPSPKLGLIKTPNSKSALDELATKSAAKEPGLPNAYRLKITKGLKTYFPKSKPNSTKKTALKLKLGNTHTSLLGGESWYTIKVNEKNAKLLWSIKGEVMIERKLAMSLYNEQGIEIDKAISDKYGHYSLPNIALEKGQYFVKLIDKNQEPAARNIRIVQTGVITKGSELEPNAKWGNANIIDINESLTAKVDKKGENDYFKFQITDEDQEAFNLILDSQNINSISFCLLDSNGKTRSCRSGKPPLVLDTLALNSGIQGLLVSRSKAVGDYIISKSEVGKLKNNNELEPNDKLSDASVFGRKGLIKGTLSKQDTDFFTLNVRQEPQLWRLQAIGNNLQDLIYHPQKGSSGTSVRASTSSKRLRLDNLYLLPGTHQFSLTSRDSTKYILRALPLGPPSAVVEREPNNNYNSAQKIDLNSHRMGLLTEKTDVDYYRFHLAAKQSIRLGLKSPTDGQLNVGLYWDKGLIKKYTLEKGENLSTRLELEPGDYFLSLRANITSEAEYELTVKHEASLATNTDFEPNDSPVNASIIPSSWVLQGNVGESHASSDWYRLPVLKKAQVIKIHSTTKPRFKIVTQDRKVITKLIKLEEGVWQAELTKDKEEYFYISGKGKYHIEIKFAADEIAIKPERSKLPIKMTIIDGNKTVAAYREEHQQLRLEVKLSNESTENISFNIEASTNDDKWKPSLESNTLKILAADSITVPVDINIDADAWPDNPVTFRMQARDDANRLNSVTTQLFAKRFIPAKNPEPFSKIPKELQGAINVASSALGAKMVSKEKNVGLKYLHDGMASVGHNFSTNRPIYKYTSPGKIQAVINLAGENLLDIIGFSFHPFGLQGINKAQLNASEVKVELSKDGESYKHALTTKLSAHTKEQFFLLDKILKARFARLTLLNSRHKSTITLGEWKVLSKPNTLTLLDKTNIASPELGGHVIWLSPSKPNYGYLKTILTSKKDAISNRYYKGEEHQWVIGFNHNRAALLQSLNWYYSKNVTTKRYLSTDVFTSMDSPLGPWKKLNTWKLDSSEKNNLTLKQPAWARFVKFIAHVEPKTKNGSYINLPEQIEIFEARENQALSILGEWGHDSSKGPYELINIPSINDKPDVLPTNITKEQAKLLNMEEEISSQVRLGEYTNWYKATIPEGKNTISATISGYPTVDAKAKLFAAEDIKSADNKELPFLPKKETSQSIDYEAYVEPGEYYIQIEEPPRSVVFTWDTSGSTAPVRGIIQQALLSYIKDVKPGLDEAHMLPFGGTFLSQNWLDQPYMLQSILNDYNGAGNSSAAETALVKATEKLKDRKGQKIIVLITDAATSSDGALWETLSEVRPRILSIGVSSRGNLVPNPAREQDLLQDWAWSSGGYYEYADSMGAVERAYDRVSSKIRQAAEYKIVVTTELKEAPKPGFLEVISTTKKKSDIAIELPAPTIEVILDASGSMFSQMGKQRRYQVARNVLIDLVDNQLPDNANFGLRVFGHKESGSCRTDLEIPIKKLNRKKAIQKIKKIAPKSYAKTPIAASLIAASGDLKKIKGEKTLLLITDGKETCDGDPEEAIAKLKESGIDTTVNIIGFAINDNALEAKFRRWAKSGGGDYQQALDAEALQQSIKKLSARKFTVVGADGEIQGPFFTDGEPIELAVGEYQIDFGNNLNKNITIKQGETITVKAGK